MKSFLTVLALTFAFFSATAGLPAYDMPGSGMKAPGGATGFFRTEKVDGRWWFVDPNGELFFAMGTDWVNCNGFNKTYNRNVADLYENSEQWAEQTVERLKQWGFNHLGTSNSPELRHRGLPFSHCANIGSRALRGVVADKEAWKKMPNVFDPGFPTGCLRAVEGLTKEFSPDDPWLFGFYIDNELQWYGKKKRENSLFLDTMEFPAGHSAKNALIEILKREHGTTNAFNQAWGQHISDWAEIGGMKTLIARTPEAKKAELAFLSELAERYFRDTTAAFRKIYPHHLVLGCRFAGNAPDWAWRACAKYCDAVSFNNYPSVDIVTGDTTEAATVIDGYARLAGDKPMLLTEWSFPSRDSGLPNQKGAGMRVDTQEERARAAELLHHLLMTRPYMAGSNFFMWQDMPAKNFGEDCNYGLVNEKDIPYDALTRMFSHLNPLAARIHRGDGDAYDLNPAPVPVPDLRPSGSADLLPLTIVNSGNDTVENFPVFFDAPGKFAHAVFSAGGKNFDATGGTLLLRNFPPKTKLSGQLYLAGNTGKTAVRFEHRNDGFVADNGAIRLEQDGKSGRFADRVLLNGTLLGSLQTLIWEIDDSGRESWKGVNHLEKVETSENTDFLFIDLTVSGTGASGARIELQFRVTLWAGSPVFCIRPLSIRNCSSDKTVALKGIFFQTPPASKQVEIDRKDGVVCSYDKTAGLRYGVIPAPLPRQSSYTFSPSFELQPGEEPDAFADIWGLFRRRGGIQVNYWGKAGQHADSMIVFGKAVKLAPGGIHTPSPSQGLLVFGAKDADFPALAKQIAGWRKLQVRTGETRKQ